MSVPESRYARWCRRCSSSPLRCVLSSSRNWLGSTRRQGKWPLPAAGPAPGNELRRRYAVTAGSKRRVHPVPAPADSCCRSRGTGRRSGRRWRQSLGATEAGEDATKQVLAQRGIRRQRTVSFGIALAVPSLSSSRSSISFTSRRRPLSSAACSCSGLTATGSSPSSCRSRDLR